MMNKIETKYPIGELDTVVHFEPNAYGFGMDWTLCLTRTTIRMDIRQIQARRFWLGQDCKVSIRLLGLHPRDLVKRLGSPDLADAAVNARLAALLLQTILENYHGDSDPIEDLFALEPWQCAVE